MNKIENEEELMKQQPNIEETDEEPIAAAEVPEEPEEEAPERPDYDAELVALIRSDLPDREKHERLNDYHENDIAQILHLLSAEERNELYRILGPDKASEVFAYVENPAEYLAGMDIERAADILENMDADDAIDTL